MRAPGVVATADQSEAPAGHLVVILAGGGQRAG